MTTAAATLAALAILPTAAQVRDTAEGVQDVLTDAVTVLPAPNGDGEIFVTRAPYTLADKPGPRVGARRHQIEDVDSLADWLKRHADAAVVEVLVGKSEIVAILDPRNPTSDRITTPLAFHPRFDRWVAATGKRLEQFAFQRLVLTAAEDFGKLWSTEGDDLGSEGQKLAEGLLKFSMGRNTEVAVEYDAAGFATVNGKSEKTNVSSKIKPYYDLYVPVHLGIVDGDDKERIYKVRLFVQVVLQDGQPVFVLSIPELEVVRRQARLDVAAHLRRRVGDTFLVGLGEAKVEAVAALRPQAVRVDVVVDTSNDPAAVYRTMEAVFRNVDRYRKNAAGAATDATADGESVTAPDTTDSSSS